MFMFGSYAFPNRYGYFGQGVSLMFCEVSGCLTDGRVHLSGSPDESEASSAKGSIHSRDTEGFSVSIHSRDTAGLRKLQKNDLKVGSVAFINVKGETLTSVL